MGVWEGRGVDGGGWLCVWRGGGGLYCLCLNTHTYTHTHTHTDARTHISARTHAHTTTHMHPLTPPNAHTHRFIIFLLLCAPMEIRNINESVIYIYNVYITEDERR